MKVYSSPIAAPQIDYFSDSREEISRKEKAHQDETAAWLRENGYPGARTGEILRVPMADGYALYMFGDNRSGCLIHLPYGDGYHSQDVAFLPKKEVLARLDREKSLAALFANRTPIMG